MNYNLLFLTVVIACFLCGCDSDIAETDALEDTTRSQPTSPKPHATRIPPTPTKRTPHVFDERKSVFSVYRVNSSLTVKLKHQIPECSGHRIGTYIWDQAHWRNSESVYAEHLRGPNARQYTCGDIFINVADYSNADKIADANMLVPFILNARRAGNKAVVWLTYGDVVQKDIKACRQFVDTFYDWVSSIPDAYIDEVLPIGLSYDVENFPSGVIVETLKYAQQRKREFSRRFGHDNILVQCTIENQLKPHDTDAVMKYADRALMMAYRNYIGPSRQMNQESGDLLQRLVWMFTKQCNRCLDDDYASQHYKAKITLMIETACKLGASCSYISFCAYDQPLNSGGGISHVINVLKEVRLKLVSSGLMTAAQRDRLMSKTAPFAVHDWDWFQCFYQDSHDTNQKCRLYHTYASTCRSA